MTFRPIRPHDAATLIAWRRSAGGAVEILMGRRHAGLAFAPGRYVFPGGRVDRSDAFVRPAGALRAEVAARLQRSATPRRAQALAAAAVRETFEETGLLLARPAEVPGRVPKGWADFAAAGMAPAFDCLDYVFRAITPPDRPRRFNARFFLVDGRHLHGTIRNSAELEDVAWVPTREVPKLSTIGVTLWALDEALAVLNTPPATTRPVPVVYMRRGQRHRTEE